MEDMHKPIKERPPICHVCKKEMVRVGSTELCGLETGIAYGHSECKTGIIIANPGCDKFFGGALFA